MIVVVELFGEQRAERGVGIWKPEELTPGGGVDLSASISVLWNMM